MKTRSFSAWAVACAVGVSLMGCATHQMPRETRGVAIVEEPGAPGVTLKLHDAFLKKLKSELFDARQGVVPGDDYTLKWSVVNVDQGNRFQRCVVGMFGVGRSTFTVHAVLTNRKGHAVSSANVCGTESWGLLGGSSKSSAEKAAEQVAMMAKLHFGTAK